MKKLNKILYVFLPTLVFNIFCMSTVNVDNHIAPRVVYWTCGAFTSFIILTEVYEYKLRKIAKEVGLEYKGDIK